MSSSRLASWAFTVFKAFCAAIIFFAVAFTVYTIGPIIETRWFPAVSKLQILSLTATAEGGSVLHAQFTKLRGCEYLGIAWFRGSSSGEFERVPIVLLRREGDTSSPDRPQGTQRAGPWIVSLPPEELRKNSFAQLSHRCHGFWVTKTDFWP